MTQNAAAAGAEPAQPHASERRHGHRVAAEMPVRIDGYATTTQDISSGGLSFESDRAYAVGDRVTAVIEYLLDGANYPFRCEAVVLRVESADGRHRVAARLLVDDGGAPQRLRSVQ